MHAPTASELLTVWERGRAQPATSQALMLLAVASPETHEEELAKLSVGQRDGQLLALREALFGPRLIGLTPCPQCGQQLELSLAATDLRMAAAPPAPETLVASYEGYQANFRLPNSDDLAAVAGQTDEAAIIHRLLSCCLFEVRHEGRQQRLDSLSSLPPALIEAIAAEMEKADPQANMQLHLNCADCGHQWVSAFDIVSFLWSEIDSWARRLLGEVCMLASAFGWREADILAMSAQRRQLYLQLIGEIT